MESKSEIAKQIRSKRGFIIDMDGVIYHGNRLLPGSTEFVSWLQSDNRQFLFLTNSSERTPKELQDKLIRLGIDVDQSHFYTSALATAAFLASQKPNGSAYFVGKPNPLMMRIALKKLECTTDETIIIGDRMDTDIIAGIESEIDTCLVLSGITSRDNMFNFAYNPYYVFDGVIDLI